MSFNLAEPPLLSIKLKLKRERIYHSDQQNFYEKGTMFYIKKKNSQLDKEGPDIVQEAGIKTIPKEKKCKKAKWLSEEALQIAEKREENSKGEKERYTHLNAEFPVIARRDKKAFLSDQCKEIEKNNRMGKTRDLFKKLEILSEHFMQRWAQ